MKHTELEAMGIAKKYQQKHSDLTDKIIKAQYNEQFDVTGGKAWIVYGEYELFEEIRFFFYVVSDETGQVEYTFNEHGTKNPHLWNEDESIKKEENDIAKDMINKKDPKPDIPKGGWSVFD
jgi:hypothetical protein